MIEGKTADIILRSAVAARERSVFVHPVANEQR
jgi:hypothetical protein